MANVLTIVLILTVIINVMPTSGRRYSGHGFDVDLFGWDKKQCDPCKEAEGLMRLKLAEHGVDKSDWDKTIGEELPCGAICYGG